MEHRVEIIALRDRSTPICSCNDIIHREFFGDRRTANAIAHLMRHLESKMHLAEENDSEEEYQIKVSDDMNCPVCSKDLDLKEGDLGLLTEDSPSIVSCRDGHDFDTYLKDNTLFLFLESYSTHSPFSTTQ